MILLAVNVNDPLDQPGRIELKFQDQKSCEQVMATMKYELKFDSFKMVTRCVKQY